MLLTGALLVPGPAPAQDGAGPSELEESLGRPRRTPVIPPEFRSLVQEATRDRIVVRGTKGDIVIDINDFEPQNFGQFGEGRFFGFSFLGYEYYGYLLVDRSAAGEEARIATGEAPVFSPDGRYFAAAQLSGASAGNLEGVGLWEVRPDGVVARFFTDALPEGEDWRIDGWPREDCVRISAVVASWQPPAGEERDTETAPRTYFGIEVGDRIALFASSEQPGCNVVDATQP